MITEVKSLISRNVSVRDYFQAKITLYEMNDYVWKLLKSYYILELIYILM